MRDGQLKGADAVGCRAGWTTLWWTFGWKAVNRWLGLLAWCLGLKEAWWFVRPGFASMSDYLKDGVMAVEMTRSKWLGMLGVLRLRRSVGTKAAWIDSLASSLAVIVAQGL